jgi:hypothetical protein
MPHAIKFKTTLPKEEREKAVKNPYKSPVRWWKVTTEGDVEGRSIRDLGIHYGHVAEIALGLNDGPCYAYKFEPAPTPEGGRRTKYNQRRKTTHINFDYSPEGRSLSCDPQAAEKWLDCPQIKVKKSNYCDTILIEWCG